MNILIVSEHASYEFGGEAVLPLHYFVQLRKKGLEVFLITHERVRKNLEKNPVIESDRVFYIPDTCMHIFLHKLSRYLPQRISVITTGAVMHLITQIYQWFLARKIIKKRSIDIVHEPAPVSPSQPSMMFALGAPVVIGPMNGGMNFPPGFEYMYGSTEKVMYAFIRFISHIANLLIPGKLFAKRLLVANKRTAKVLPYFSFGKTVQLVENGVFESEINSALLEDKKSPSIEVTRLLFVGRLVELKALDILIESLVLLNDQNISLTIVGDGDQRSRLEQQVLDSPFKLNVDITGWKSRDEVEEYYANADIFILPSLRECGGAVILEAMAKGVPSISLDWGGPQDYITPETGVLIQPSSKQDLIKQLAEKIRYLVDNKEITKKMGKNALIHVKEYFTWEKKAGDIMNIYSDVLKGEKG